MSDSDSDQPASLTADESKKLSAWLTEALRSGWSLATSERLEAAKFIEAQAAELERLKSELRITGDLADQHEAQRDEARVLAALLAAAAKSMLPLLAHAEACEASADDGFGERLRSLRRQLNAANAALAAFEEE